MQIVRVEEQQQQQGWRVHGEFCRKDVNFVYSLAGNKWMTYVEDKTVP